MARLDDLSPEILIIVMRALDDGRNNDLRSVGLVARRLVDPARRVMLNEVVVRRARGVVALVGLLEEHPALASAVMAMTVHPSGDEPGSLPSKKQMVALVGMTTSLRHLAVYSEKRGVSARLVDAVAAEGYELRSLVVGPAVQEQGTVGAIWRLLRRCSGSWQSISASYLPPPDGAAIDFDLPHLHHFGSERDTGGLEVVLARAPALRSIDGTLSTLAAVAATAAPNVTRLTLFTEFRVDEHKLAEVMPRLSSVESLKIDGLHRSQAMTVLRMVPPSVRTLCFGFNEGAYPAMTALVVEGALPSLERVICSTPVGIDTSYEDLRRACSARGVAFG